MKAASVERLINWIHQRHLIYLRRFKLKERKPWTQDKILQRYRFCNVYRELDTVTQWIGKNWREPNENDPDLWFAMAVARQVNLPATLEEIGYPVPWSAKKFVSVLQRRKKEGLQLYNGAYMISTHGVKAEKAEYLAHQALTPMWKNRALVRPKSGEKLFDLHYRLVAQRDLASFMSGQIIADLKYALPYKGAEDWWTFAVSGPGSRRGLNRILGRDINTPWKEIDWYCNLQELRVIVDKEVKKMQFPKIHAQDLQNCLCEFDKYERVRLGEGRPKSTYPGV